MYKLKTHFFNFDKRVSYPGAVVRGGGGRSYNAFMNSIYTIYHNKNSTNFISHNIEKYNSIRTYKKDYHYLI